MSTTTGVPHGTVIKSQRGLMALREVTPYLADLDVAVLRVLPYSFLTDAEIEVQLSTIADAQRLADRLREVGDPPVVLAATTTPTAVQVATKRSWCGHVLRISACELTEPKNTTQETKEPTR